MRAVARSSEVVRVSRLALQPLDELDDALELMYFGLRGMTREADQLLEKLGFSRVHHRILFVIARRDGVTVGELQDSLGVSKQAVHGPLRQLLDGGCVTASRISGRHRFKALQLTRQGADIEAKASECERKVMRDAFQRSGRNARSVWETVMGAVAENA